MMLDGTIHKNYVTWQPGNGNVPQRTDVTMYKSTAERQGMKGDGSEGCPNTVLSQAYSRKHATQKGSCALDSA